MCKSGFLKKSRYWKYPRFNFANIWRPELDSKFVTNAYNMQKLDIQYELKLDNTRVAAYTFSEFLKENQEESNNPSHPG